jgi:ech hydrogenase subunit B
VIGGCVSGLDKVVTARCQSRIGPPLLQPFHDVAKLLSKEPMVVNIWQMFCAYAYLAAASISVALFLLHSDLLLILFRWSMWSSASAGSVR